MDKEAKASLSSRIADAEERLRQSIAQRIDRNRAELTRLQHEQTLFEQAASPDQIRTSSAPPRATGSSELMSDAADDIIKAPPAVDASATTGTMPSLKGPRTPPTTHGGSSVAELDVCLQIFASKTKAS